MVAINIITQGCSANQADSEFMAGILKSNGYSIIDDSENADVVIVNSCTVKNQTETEFHKVLTRFKHKKVIIAGCISQSDPQSVNNYTLIGPYQLDKISEAVSHTLQDKRMEFLERISRSPLTFPKINHNPYISIIPISQGCLGHCTFCKTKQARGILNSYPISEIVRAVSAAVSEGAKEIWLTSQDTGAYGKDINTSIITLLQNILTIPKDFHVRLGMGNPEHFILIIDELLEVMKDKRFLRFLHIPVQAGNNEVLHAMKREYSIDQYQCLIKSIKSAFPKMTLATDIICGFPGETDDQFKDTLMLIKDLNFDVINISRFSARSGTVAAQLEGHHGRILKERTRELTTLFRSLSLKNNQRWIGWTGNVLFTDMGKNDTLIGRNYTYKQVIIKGDKTMLGKKVKVKITDATTFYLKACLE